MKSFEKLGIFYLGKIVNSKNGKTEENELLLYDSKDLTTHAVCVGMTGSGKTGLGISILEEAGIDKIPAIVIDPKGDLSNLLLTFPELSPAEFKPWIDKAEAERKGENFEEYSNEIAAKWKKGLADWGEDAARIKNFRNSVDLAIYTPASNSGIPISILNSFAAPEGKSADPAELREKIASTASSLLGLLGIVADPIKSREHILISKIIEQAWLKNKNLDITALIQQVQKPPFDKIGALDIDTFYPPKERMELSIKLNNLLASPGFQAWMEGVPLDVKQLLYTQEGKPRIAVISIAHLSDSERMFFVTLLLNEFVGWMRRQEGTSSLRAVLYMDEIFGFFPPTAMPPSKLPMLTLLKQARAFGIGIVLVTQNPVDLDYKGLSNCGTWFIGKLQTERDKSRVIEGLKTASNGEIDANSLDKMIALTGNRTFIMRSIHKKDPILFQTRWTLSYLRGPLTLAQIASLTDRSKIPESIHSTASAKQNKSVETDTKPAAPLEIEEYFVNPAIDSPSTSYAPRVLAIGKLHFIDAKCSVDLWKEIYFALPVGGDGKTVDWEKGENFLDLKDHLEKNPLPKSTFEELPVGLMQAKNYKGFEKDFSSFLYQNQTLSIYRASELNMISQNGESEGDFRVRISQSLREKRDEQVKKLRDKYSEKMATLTNRLRRAEEKMNEKQQKAWMQKIQTAISFFTALIAALFGRKLTKSTISQAGTSLRRASQIGTDSQRASSAEEEVKICRQQLDETEELMNQEISAIAITPGSETQAIEKISIHPRKSDISVEKIALVWWAQC